VFAAKYIYGITREKRLKAISGSHFCALAKRFGKGANLSRIDDNGP
jgi:hypothetical protein